MEKQNNENLKARGMMAMAAISPNAPQVIY